MNKSNSGKIFFNPFLPVKSSGIRQSKILKETVVAGTGGKVTVKKADLEIELVNPFPPGASPLTSKIIWC